MIRPVSSLAARTLLFGLIALLGGAAARADISLDVSDGIDNAYRFDSPTPLVVRLSGEGRTANALLELVVRTQAGTTTYTQPLRLHAGPLNEKHTLYYVRPNNATPDIVAQLSVDGRVIAKKKVESAIPINDTQPAIVSLTQDRSGLTFLNSIDLNYPHRGASRPQPATLYGGRFANPRAGGRPGSGGSGARILRPFGSALPDSANGYALADIILLGDLPIDSLTEDEWNAILGWVKDGGTLVISGGSDINRLRAKQLADILPITPTGVQQAASLAALTRDYGGALKPGSTPIITGALKSDALPFCREGTTTLVAVRRFGIGTVIFTAFDVNAPEFRTWTGQPRLWEEFMRLAVGDMRLTDAVKATARASYYVGYGGYGGYGSYSGYPRRALEDALAGVQSTEAPSFAFIGLFLLAYIVFLVPVNYFILRSRDKKEWAWITAPAIILLFSTGAYAVGRSIKGGQLYLRFASVVEGAAGEDDWQAYSAAGIFSPSQRRYDVSIADRNALASEMSDSTSPYQRATVDSANQELTIERTDRTTIKNALVNMWDHRSFEFESHASLGSIAASVVPDGPMLKVQVTNNTKYKLTDCGIAQMGASAVPIGTLAPGQSSAEIRVPVASVFARGGVALPSEVAASGSSASRIKQALFTMLVRTETSVPGNNPLLFTGWFDAPAVGLSLADESPRVEGMTLLVAHLAIPGGRFAPPRTSAQIPNSSGYDPFAGYGGPGPRMRMPALSPPPPYGPYGRFGADANGFNNYAYTLANQGRLDEALQTAYHALQLAPEDGNILDTVAEMHQRRREYAKAVPFYKRALARQPGGGITETHEKYGETLLALGRKSEAIPHLQRAAASMNDAWGIKARQVLRSLGIQVRQSMPGAFPPTGPPSVPPAPATGSGTRRFIRPGPNGGRFLIIQRWSQGAHGTQSNTTMTYYPPGAPISP